MQAKTAYTGLIYLLIPIALYGVVLNADKSPKKEHSTTAVVDSPRVKPSGDRSTTPSLWPKRTLDSLLKHTRIWVGSLDTSGKAPWNHISWEQFDTLRKGNYWLMRDSGFVFKDWGCYKWFGKLGDNPTDPDTIWFEDTCKAGCIKAFTVPLGCWDSTEIEVPTDSVFVCDTLCQVYSYSDSVGWLLTDSDVGELQSLQQALTGTIYDTCRVGVYCFILGSGQSTTFIDVRNVTTGGAYKGPCPSIVGPGDSIYCVPKSVFEAFIKIRTAAGKLPTYINVTSRVDTLVVDCNEYSHYPDIYNITPSKLFIRSFSNCRWVTDLTTRKIPSWVPAGRDTVLYIDTCQTECPAFVVNCQNGTWETGQYEIPVFRYDTLYDTIQCNAVIRQYEILDSVQTRYNAPQSQWIIPKAKWDSLALAHGVTCDTLSPYVYYNNNLPQWQVGKIPVYTGYYRIQWDNPTTPSSRVGTDTLRSLDFVTIQCNYNEGLWLSNMMTFFGYPQNSPLIFNTNVVRKYCWIDSSVITALCAVNGAFDEQCSVVDTFKHTAWYAACPKDTVYYITCRLPSGEEWVIDSIAWVAPDFVKTESVEEIVLPVQIGTEIATYTYWQPGQTTYNIQIIDTCNCQQTITLLGESKDPCDLKMVNLCPTGMQPFWLDDNTIAFYYDCGEVTINGNTGKTFNLPDYDYVDRSVAITNARFSQEIYALQTLQSTLTSDLIAHETAIAGLRDSVWVTESKFSDFEPAHHKIYLIDATSNSITITLPGSPANGMEFVIKRVDNSGETVTILGTVDASEDPTVGGYKAYRIVSHGGSWYFIGSF